MRFVPSALACLAIAALVPASVVYAEEPASVAKRPQAKGEQIKGTSIRMMRPAGFEVARATSHAACPAPERTGNGGRGCPRV